MPYNFQGAGGIINTGPIEDIYYLDPATFTQSLIPNNDADAATKFYVDRHVLEVFDTDILDPNLVEAMAVEGRINIAVVPNAMTGNNDIVLTVADISIDTAQLAANAVTEDKIVDGEVTQVKLADNVTISSIGAPTADVDFSAERIINLADPVDPADAATRAYVDAAVDTEIATRFVADSELDIRITAIEDAYVVSSAYDTENDTLTLTDQDGVDTVVDVGSVDTEVIATRRYVDSEILQHFVESVGVIGGSGIDATTNDDSDEVIAIDADTEFFQFNDADQLTLVPGSITGDAETDGLIASGTIRGTNIADNSILGNNLNANIAGDGIRKDTDNAGGGQRLSAHLTDNGGLEFTDVTQSILGVDTVVDRTLAVDTGIIATRTYVDDAIDDLIDGAPDALDTLNELSEALNDDSDFGATVAVSYTHPEPTRPY